MCETNLASPTTIPIDATKNETQEILRKHGINTSLSEILTAKISQLFLNDRNYTPEQKQLILLARNKCE